MLFSNNFSPEIEKRKNPKQTRRIELKNYYLIIFQRKKNICNNNLVKNEIMRRSKLQSQVLSLYKQCLRAAESKPGFKVIKKPVMLCGVKRSASALRRGNDGFDYAIAKDVYAHCTSFGVFNA